MQIPISGGGEEIRTRHEPLLLLAGFTHCRWFQVPATTSRQSSLTRLRGSPLNAPVRVAFSLVRLMT